MVALNAGAVVQESRQEVADFRRPVRGKGRNNFASDVVAFFFEPNTLLLKLTIEVFVRLGYPTVNVCDESYCCSMVCCQTCFDGADSIEPW